jgi:hypothetical protein
MTDSAETYRGRFSSLLRGILLELLAAAPLAEAGFY